MRTWLFVLALLGLFTGCARDPASDAEAARTAEIDRAAERNDAADTEAGFSRNDALLASLTIFVLAVFVGFELITKVPPTLHTPLMSGSNAISGITVVGAALMAGNGQSGFAALLGLVAVIMATVNVVGGFLVTDRMLGMFKKKS